jgi:hypothetical protein
MRRRGAGVESESQRALRARAASRPPLSDSEDSMICVYASARGAVEPKGGIAVNADGMATKAKKTQDRNARPRPDDEPGARMTAEQCALLRKLAFDGYEPDAFSPHLSRQEAARRIAMLEAKLRLLDGPPHTL